MNTFSERFTAMFAAVAFAEQAEWTDAIQFTEKISKPPKGKNKQLQENQHKPVAQRPRSRV